MELIGNLLKMESELTNPVTYTLKLSNEVQLVNSWIGKTIEWNYTGTINCIHCGRKTNKSFSQGYCYPCFVSLPQTDEGVLRPELNRAHEGISRDMEWSKRNDLIDHYVYLAFTSEIKVGVTRHTQIPTRWIDQGAEFATILAKTPYRQLAGLIEVSLKSFLSDKTNWRKMLSGKVEEIPDLQASKAHFSNQIPIELQKYITPENEVTHIHYPVEKYPEKIKSVNFDNDPSFQGVLTGIKGQYLLFADGTVMNIRKHNGYFMNIKIL
jgi:hypothetical protein